MVLGIKNLTYIGIAATGLIFIVFGFLMFNSETGPVPILNTFEDKVVYGTDSSLDQDALRADCNVRGGVFQECGSMCPSDAEVCAAVCAFTCDFSLITNFAECAKAGYPVMESYPRQCRVPGGELFVEEI